MSKKIKNRDERMKDIRRYLDGEMSGRERNAFEKKLQGDPFEEEALEGLSSISSDELEKDMSLLDARLRRRTHKRTPVYYRIAAAVVILMAISSLLLVRELRKPAMMMSENIAELKDTTEGEIIAPQNLAVDKAREDITEASKENTDRRSAIQEESPAQEKDEEIVDDRLMLDIQAEREEVFEHVGAEEAIEAKEDVKVVGAEEAIEAKEDVKVVGAEEAIEAIEAKEAVKAEAIVSEGQPVSAARAKKVSQPVAPLKAEEQADTEVRGIALSEEDIISDKEILPDRPAEPLGGMKEFKTYLETDQIYPADWDAGDREIVKLEVRIGKTGAIQEIKIIRSPGDQFSEEAKRLIREGPPWQPATKDSEKIEDRVKIRIVFKR